MNKCLILGSAALAILMGCSSTEGGGTGGTGGAGGAGGTAGTGGSAR
ncbi:MAG: hypothetical protein JRD94_17090, partial [Deltaproteobacteria bacterium]|nr:hypothetical protein [Deltaproteobacteria bacterium]